MNIKKGLADNGDGEFILNESGTSVSTDKVPPDQGADAEPVTVPEKEKAATPEPGKK